jgi:hypothetical protein
MKLVRVPFHYVVTQNPPTLGKLSRVWFLIYSQATNSKEFAELSRGEHDGILFASDRWAIEFQYFYHLADRAYYRLTGIFQSEIWRRKEIAVERRPDHYQYKNKKMRKALEILRPIWESERAERLARAYPLACVK